MGQLRPVNYFFSKQAEMPGFRACVFDARTEDCTPCMESDVQSMDKFLLWGDAHKKQLLIGAGAVIVVGLAIAFWFVHKNNVQVDANNALSMVVSHEATPSSPSPSAEAYLKIADDYAGTDAGERAAVMGASELYAAGKYDEAHGQFQKFMQQYPGSPFAGTAALGIAACADALGQTNDAIAGYKNVTEHYPGPAVSPRARFALSRLEEGQGNAREAENELQTIAKEFPGLMNAEISERLVELLKAHPELQQTNPAPSVRMPIAPSSPAMPRAASPVSAAPTSTSAAPTLIPKKP